MRALQYHMTSSPIEDDEWAGLTQTTFDSLTKLLEFVELHQLVVIKVVLGREIDLSHLDL